MNMSRREALTGLVAAGAAASSRRRDAYERYLHEEAAVELQRPNEPQIPRFEIGKTYLTIGGWSALVVWATTRTSWVSLNGHKNAHEFVVIHRPGELDESGPKWHDNLGKPLSNPILDRPAPCYDANHPASLVLPDSAGGWVFDPTGKFMSGGARPVILDGLVVGK